MLKKTRTGKKTGTLTSVAITLLAVLLALLSSASLAGAQIPSPRGISGYVYDLDGITQAPAGTGFSIENAANGQVVQGKTGKPGNSGKYSASIGGNDGDLIILRAWNIERSSSRNFTLAGVMRGVNLLLNLTLSRYPPAITSTPVTAATEDEQYSYDADASDYNPDETLLFGLTQSPPGMAINPVTGLITWTPENSNVGSNSVTVEVSDGNFTAAQAFTVAVANVNDAPTITSAPVTEATEDSSYAYAVTATDEDGDSLTYLLTEAPPGMAVSRDTGAISWIPLNENVGSNAAAVTVSDGNGGTATQSFTIFVQNVNDAPQIVSAAVTAATQDAPYYYDVQAADEDGDALTYWLVQRPGGMVINGSTGAVSWTPNSSQAGTSAITVRVTDGQLIADQSFAVSVANVNDLPAITSIPVTAATQDEPYQYDAEASDPDNDAIAFSLISAPQNMTVSAATGIIRWTPTNWQTGPNNVTVGASDSNGTTTQTFTVVVENVNDAPVITSAPVTAATEDSPYSYDAEASDPDGDSLTYSLRNAPSGMLIDAPSGRVLWTPDNSRVGSNAVLIEVSDGNLTASQAFAIVVANTNDAPLITTLPETNATANELYLYDVNATDPDGDTVNFTLLGTPEKPLGKMGIDNLTGLITWRPHTNAVGNNVVTVQASDGSLTANQTFTVVVSKGKDTAHHQAPSGSGGSGREYQGEPRRAVIGKGDVPVRELRILFNTAVTEAAVDVSLMPQRPPEVKSIQKRVYKYLQIKNVNFDSGAVHEATINFRVEKGWLKNNKLAAQNVALNRYTETGWQELPTSAKGEDGSFAYYEATSPGFSVFAISVKSEASLGQINSELPISLDVANVKPSYPVYGVIVDAKGRQVGYGARFAIRNTANNDTVAGTTGIGPSSGMFFAVISGRSGDILQLTVSDSGGNYAEAGLALSEKLEEVVLVADFRKHKLSLLKTKAGNSLDTATGLAVIDRLMLSKPARPFGYALLAIAVLAAITAVAKLLKKLKPRKQKPGGEK